ncbi:C-terminal binding protein [Rubinisphaera margarita]|uniref:C-terminal binding protein n=1 Tax=Rubinisphaera margarita TaxID=2909586 RepID=UPI001EE94092|nr:C-terminal binding protein [Rubinisphaera margarita]MCG6155203.1 C-terminal binding protein [Rubinisphaera margarita]
MSDRPLVVVTDFIEEPLAIEREILGSVAEVVALNAFEEKELHGVIEKASAVMVYHTVPITADTINRLERCKLIVRCGVGYDNVDRPAARKRGISVANVPDYGTEEVADSAIAMALAFTRGTHILNHRLQREFGPWSYQQIVPKPRLRGEVFGIVGLGRIGIATALRAKALGCDVRFYDPYVEQGMDKALGIRQVHSLPELLSAAYVVSLHCPLTEETANLIDEEMLGQMRPGSYLINTARGGVVHPKIILHALENNLLAGAGIDVLPDEPPSPDNPLIQAWRNPDHPAYERLILNPHAAFYCEEGLEEMRVKGSQNCLRVLQGMPPLNVVN